MPQENPEDGIPSRREVYEIAQKATLETFRGLTFNGRPASIMGSNVTISTGSTSSDPGSVGITNAFSGVVPVQLPQEVPIVDYPAALPVEAKVPQPPEDGGKNLAPSMSLPAPLVVNAPDMQHGMKDPKPTHHHAPKPAKTLHHHAPIPEATFGEVGPILVVGLVSGVATYMILNGQYAGTA